MSEALAGLAALVEKLRRECPWDREQTPETIRTYLLEECYETLEAIDSGDPEALRDELGDLLFQVFFLATLASERRWFDLDAVATAVARKMTDRHPHVFGETKAGSAAEVKKGWETRKRREAGAAEDPLGSIPGSLPAVAAAYRMTSRAADLGSGIGSVALICAWRLPGAAFCTVEAQAMSARLARKSIQYNGLGSRFTVYEGDLRDASILAHEQPFDLVTGSPPYWPASAATGAAHPQAVPARIEIRGSVFDYAAAASRILATGGMFVFVFSYIQRERAEEAVASNGLVLLRRRDVVFKEGDPPMISLFAAMRASDLPPGRQPWIEPPLIIRTKSGAVHPEYAAIRISFGFPPGDIGPDSAS